MQSPAVSRSLLPPPNWKEKYQFNPRFDLGIGEWMGEGPDTTPSDYEKHWLPVRLHRCQCIQQVCILSVHRVYF